MAAQNGHCATLRLLVQHGANVAQPWRNGVTALFLAALEGHVEMTRGLALEMNHPTDISEDSSGFTPIFAAAQRGQ